MDLPPYANRVENGGFEDGDLAGWVRDGDTSPIRSGFLSRTGEHAALLGFRSDGAAPGESMLSQVVAVPEETPALGFWYRVYRSSGADSVEPNTFEVLLATGEGGEPRVLHTDRLSASEDWQYQWVDVGAFAGERVKLTFRLSQPSADLRTVVYLDNVALGASTPQEAVWRDVFLPLLLRNWP
ncbi:MAG: hypothetical protein MAG451_00673 [Anaerolineales bacterium]|nr:hypothetical protein [Anaerolineales bacterium]